MIGHRGENFFQGPFIWSGKIHSLDERFMSKSDPSNTFGDFSKKIKLSPDRQNLKPVNPALSFDQYLTIAIKEGYALLATETKNSVKKPEPSKQPSSVLTDSLGKMSVNPYVRARTQILTKMSPKARSVIEEMERIGNTANPVYDKFARSVTLLGDTLSSSN